MSEKLLYCWEVPLKIISEANSTEHWTKKHARHKSQRMVIGLMWLQKQPEIPFPCVVKMTRISSRLLDDDNLVGAFKHVRDYVADCIIPHKPIGRSDSDKRIKWEYAQEKGKPQGMRLEIFKRDEDLYD